MQPASKQAAALASAEAALDTLWGAASSAAPCSAGAVADALRALAEAASSSSQAVALAKQRGAVSLLRRWLADADESVRAPEMAIAARLRLLTQA